MKCINLLCVGTGGVGQSYFMNYLKNHFKINHVCDKDKLKHLSCPSRLPNFKNNIKIIYIYNKTFKSICSHFRREWQNRQIQKLNNNKKKTKFKNVNEYFSLTEHSKKDIFGCEYHFLRWYYYKHNYPIYFLNLNTINKKNLSEFLNCDIEIFNKLNIVDINTNNKYNNIISNFPTSYKLYKDIDEKIDKLSEYYNLNKKVLPK